MTYVALLRGINVGGKGIVSMAKLQLTFENSGFDDVKTYINSGNVIFSSDSTNPVNLTAQLEKAIALDFGFLVSVQLRDLPQMEKLVSAIPDNWVNDANTKCDVMFLQATIDRADILKQIQTNPEMEDIKYVPGAVIWRINRKQASKSKVLKLAGTELYKSMTVRNPNTVRKILDLMRQV